MVVQRQTAAVVAPPGGPDCDDLFTKIREVIVELVQRKAELLSDPLHLQWDNWSTPKILPDGTNVGSVVGHQQQFQNKQTQVRRLIQEWDDDDCNNSGRRIQQPDRDLAYEDTPVPIQQPRPDSGPKPWETPGAHRVAEVAGAAGIGGAIGLVAGGVLGGLLGAAGGTLVAPGVGTVGGGVAGAVEGAALGAEVGAALGTVGGALYGILTGG